ncbi:MAG: transcriptional repressor [Acholeplasmatales bacterium]|nr:transcriptional repressor [Acholeplasmatales bacterium]
MEKGYNTKPKEYILSFLKNHKNKRFSVKEMYDSIIGEGYNINLATIYRNVNTLENEGVLLRHQGNDTNYCTYQYVENSDCLAHFHFECIKCGKVSHLGAKETNDFLRLIKNKLYFTVEPQNTYIRGLCNQCKGVFIGI